MTPPEQSNSPSHDERIDMETLRFIRDAEIPAWVPSQRLNGLCRRGLAERKKDGRMLLTLKGRQILRDLASRNYDATREALR